MSQVPLESRSRAFVLRSLAGLGAPDPLRPLRESHDVEVWSGSSPPRSAELVGWARGHEGLLCLLTDRIDEAFIEACPDLRVISSMSVGVDHIDLDAAGSRGIPAGHTPGVLAETTADLTFGLLLAAAWRPWRSRTCLRGCGETRCRTGLASCENCSVGLATTRRAHPSR